MAHRTRAARGLNTGCGTWSSMETCVNRAKAARHYARTCSDAATNGQGKGKGKLITSSRQRPSGLPSATPRSGTRSRPSSCWLLQPLSLANPLHVAHQERGVEARHGPNTQKLTRGGRVAMITASNAGRHGACCAVWAHLQSAAGRRSSPCRSQGLGRSQLQDFVGRCRGFCGLCGPECR